MIVYNNSKVIESCFISSSKMFRMNGKLYENQFNDESLYNNRVSKKKSNKTAVLV